MNSRLQPSVLVLLFFCVGTFFKLSAQDNLSQDSVDFMIASWHGIPEAVVATVGLASGAHGLDEVPGALYLITSKELDRFAYTDPLRALRTVAGVNITEEDGFGLRPNIGLRGSGTDRSSRITIMEDGILITPAPYTASAAYYFPSIARMSSIEILKGSSQIAFGPQTASGAINLISTLIPKKTEAKFDMAMGSFGGAQFHLTVGSTSHKPKGSFSYLIELLQLQSDGFKAIDNVSGVNMSGFVDEMSTGFSKSDRLIKLRYSTPSSNNLKQSIEVKMSDVSEISNETYLGLSKSDFEQSPLLRYAASAKDVMNASQSQVVITHTAFPLPNIEMKTDLYRTSFARNWYKLDRIVDSTGMVLSLKTILDYPEIYSESFSYLKGYSTPLETRLDVKANNRNYFSRGVQHRTKIKFGVPHSFDELSPARQNQIIFGIRIHTDGVDRFQWRDSYAMRDGIMMLSELGIHGTAGNRVETAIAIASYVRATLHFKNLTLTPGLRSEIINFERTDFGSSDLDRAGEGEYRSNFVRALLPGLGFNYRINTYLDAFAGIHRGFIPPGSNPETSPEYSLNYELGLRFSSRFAAAQLVVFSNEYSNLLGADMNASGGSGSGDLFNGGSAQARGLELEFTIDPFSDGPFDHLSLPIRLAYTYTDAKFTHSFNSELQAWGEVEIGDAIPYIAPHQLSIVTSVVSGKFSTDLSARYTSEINTEAAPKFSDSGMSIQSSIIIDSSIRYNFTDTKSASIGITNLLNSVYEVSRRPYGLRPNMPRAVRLRLSLLLPSR
ncbi:MAG: TonB-dependent receptor [Bacteroidetes bacterium]|nr:MAG: TonB-dependent receptor [Bacteroidota bacterium]